jgi:hypothetical protein
MKRLTQLLSRMRNTLRKQWLRFYFHMMPAHVLIEHRRNTLKQLSEPTPIKEHNRCDPSLPAFHRQQAD